MANAACATFDAAEFADVVGTLSATTLFLVVTRSEEGAREITDRLHKLLNR